jgi:hypothetical protein
VKTARQSTDWLAIASLDALGREVRVWESGLLDWIGAPASHATVATARSGSSYSVMMNNVSSLLVPEARDVPITKAHNRLVIRATQHLDYFDRPPGAVGVR